MIISQSLTKELGLFVIKGQIEEEDVCPALFKYRQENKTSSKAMDYGLYGETLLIGGTAKNDNIVLPRKKNGDMYVGEKRILKQVDNARAFMEENNIIVAGNTQVGLSFKHGEHTIRGTLDIFPTPVNNSPCNIVDVKFAQDIYNDFFTYKKPSTSSYCWGDLDVININQPLFYHALIRNAKKEDHDDSLVYKLIFHDSTQRMIQNASFYFFVIGFGKPVFLKNEQIMLHEVKWNKRNEELFYYLLDATINKYKQFEADNFKPVKVNIKTCDNCPVRANNNCSLWK